MRDWQPVHTSRGELAVRRCCISGRLLLPWRQMSYMKATVCGTRMRHEAMQTASLQASYMHHRGGYTQWSEVERSLSTASRHELMAAHNHLCAWPQYCPAARMAMHTAMMTVNFGGKLAVPPALRNAIGSVGHACLCSLIDCDSTSTTEFHQSIQARNSPQDDSMLVPCTGG